MAPIPANGRRPDGAHRLPIRVIRVFLAGPFYVRQLGNLGRRHPSDRGNGDVDLHSALKSSGTALTSRNLVTSEPTTTGLLGEEGVRRTERPSLLHMSDSRLQFKFGKAKAELVREHIAKLLDAAYCSAIHFT
jgi:hypothetical protein